MHYLRQAGNNAAARSALQDARAWFGQALGALDTLPESRFTLEEAFEIRLALRSVLAQLGELRQVLELLREAEALAERLNDNERRGRVCAFMTNIHTRLGTLYARMGKGEQARDHLATASRMYRGMDMRFWLDRAEAESGGQATQ